MFVERHSGRAGKVGRDNGGRGQREQTQSTALTGPGKHHPAKDTELLYKSSVQFCFIFSFKVNECCKSGGKNTVIRSKSHRNVYWT